MKKILLSLIGILCSMSLWAAEQTSSFTLGSYTASASVAITSYDNTNVSLTIGKDGGGSIGNPNYKDGVLRGFRVQTNMYFEITVPSGKYIKKVDFTANNNGNLSRDQNTDGKFGIWSVTGDVNTWILSAKAVTYTWTNGGTNLCSPIKFKQTGNGDVYISAVKVYYDDAPQLSNVAPTIKTQPTNKTTVTGVAATLSMAADGIPAPSIQWYSCDDAEKTNAQAIKDATNNSYNFQTNTAGTYYFYAVASNTEGNATTNVVSVTVNQSYVMTFSKDDANIIGTIPSAIRSNGEFKVTTPKYNYSLYLAGKTFTHWTDGVKNYLPNTEYTLSSDVTVTPVFADNTTSLDRLTGSTTVNFIKSTSVAATYQSSNQNAVVEQLTDGGKTIDVALIIQNGKFDLQPGGPRAQTNQNTVVSIPVVDGAVVEIGIYDNNSTKTHNCTINNESVASYLDGEATTTIRNMTYTYHGVATSIDYVVNVSKMYATKIDVTYPGQFDPTTTFSMKTAAKENVSIEASADHIALPATANLTINGGSVTVSNQQAEAKPLVTSAGFAMTNGNTFFTVTLNQALHAGDVITATMSDNGSGLKFATTDAYSSDYPGVAAADKNFSYTVTEGDGICGETTFNIFRATSSTTYFNNFKISRPATVATPSINAQGYGTFSCEYDVQITGAKAYKATINDAGDALVCEEIANGLVPAGEGVLLFKAGTTVATTATALYVAYAPAVSNNELQATTHADGSLAAIESALVLSGNTFVPFNGVAFAAGKAYLPYVASAKSFRIVFPQDGQTTGINTAAAAQKVANAKFIENGRIVIVKDGAKYNVAGQVIK